MQPLPSMLVAAPKSVDAGPGPTAAIRPPSSTTCPSAYSVSAASTVAMCAPSITVSPDIGGSSFRVLVLCLHQCEQSTSDHLDTPRRSRRTAFRCEMYGGDDRLVTRASAEVARQRLPNVHCGRCCVASQQVVRRYDQARRAETALHGAGVEERLLHRM